MNLKKLKKKILYKDGKYTGDSIYTIYGQVQMGAIIRNGKLRDIEIIDYPQDIPPSKDLNDLALVELKKEAIKIQNSDVNIVSGATDTSEGFKESLKSALKKAKK